MASLKMAWVSLSLNMSNVDFTAWISISESQGHKCSFTVHFTEKKKKAKCHGKDGGAVSKSVLDAAALPGSSIFPD